MINDNITKAEWTRFLISAASAGAAFEPVVVKTLKSHYHEVVKNLACRKHEALLISEQPDIVKFERKVNETATQMMKQRVVQVRPFVDIPLDSHVPVVVCLDLEQVTEDNWCEVLDVLKDIDFTPGKTEFGEPRMFGPMEDVSPSSDDVLHNMGRSFI